MGEMGESRIHDRVMVIVTENSAEYGVWRVYKVQKEHMFIKTRKI